MSINSQSSKKNAVEVELLRQRGERFAAVKEKLGFNTLEDFGKALADAGAPPIDKSTLSKMERGIMAISKKILVELTSKFKVNTNYLLYGTGDMFTENKSVGNSNNQSTNDIDLESTKTNDMNRLINALERIAMANQTLANTNADVVRELLESRKQYEEEPKKVKRG